MKNPLIAAFLPMSTYKKLCLGYNRQCWILRHGSGAAITAPKMLGTFDDTYNDSSRDLNREGN